MVRFQQRDKYLLHQILRFVLVLDVIDRQGFQCGKIHAVQMLESFIVFLCQVFQKQLRVGNQHLSFILCSKNKNIK